MGIERVRLADGYFVSRVVKGSWQLAGGHGPVDAADAHEGMRRFVEAGITTFDCADIYTGVEELIGGFLHRYRDAFRTGELPPVQVHTKCVPDLESLSTLRRCDVESTIDRSLQRLGVERLDLVQFHWWDFSIPGYVEAARWLQRLQDAGKIRHVGLTNFDVDHLREILDAGVPVLSNQVQFSVLDRRPRARLAPFCDEHKIALLCYGTVAGGFLSDRYFGAPEPAAPCENRSLTKYRLIIEECGPWETFQRLLVALRQVADRYGKSIAQVASRYVLQQRSVGAVILGVRHTGHLAETEQLFAFRLDEEDLGRIDAASSCGPAGPVYGLERDRKGPHGAIMHYDLNRGTKA